MFYKKLVSFARQRKTQHTLFWVSLGLGAGILLWNGFVLSLDATSTTEFCISCHSMSTYVYQDYKQSIHYKNPKGIQAGCGDCHIPKPFFAKLVRKTIGMKDVYHTILGTIDTPEKFAARKQYFRELVRSRMRASDSRECRSCHHLEHMDFARQNAVARRQHQDAKRQRQTCIDCHQGVGHQPKPLDQDGEESFSLE